MTVTLLIIIVTVLVSYKALSDRAFKEKLKHYPIAEVQNKEWYRMITSGFVHDSWMHLGFNMYVLYNFGAIVESLFLNHFGDVIGRLVFLLLYIAMIIIADIPSLLKHRDNRYYASLGASGAVSGIIFIFIIYSPWSPLGIIFIPIQIPAIILGILYLAYSSWASKNANDNIGHDAHFYGALAGMVLTMILIPSTLGNFIEQFTSGFPF